MAAQEHGSLHVSDAAVPVQYRVYPETPLSEVIDLIVRREIRAIPVVGESFEVLGILTAGDALQRVLRGGSGEGEPTDGPLLARDVMTRSVLCVSETQALVDAGNMMVKRDVEQLPVVREGQLVGILTRDAILKALHPGPTTETESEQDDE